MKSDSLCRRVMTAFVLLPAICASTVSGDEPRTPGAALPLARLLSAEKAWEHRKKQREFLRGEFAREFKAARGMSVEQRLARAAEVTASLRSKAEAASAELLDEAGIEASSRAKVFLRREDFARLLAARPWLREYWGRRDDRRMFVETFDYTWPTGADAPALRKLLDSQDYDVAALAVEALATLHEPEDVPRIAGVLDKRLPVVDILQSSEKIPRANLYTPRAERELGENPLELQHRWRGASLQDYAVRALRRMTGDDLDQESFWSWLSKHQANRDSLWFWQQRMTREFDRAELKFLAESSQSVENFDAGREKLQTIQQALRQQLRRELAERDPEVEAKVCLLTVHPHAGGADVTGPSYRFVDLPVALRLPPARLLELMRRERLWTDVDWTTKNGGFNIELYNRLVERIALSSAQLLRPRDAAALRDLLAKNRESLWWSGQAALILGAGRLMPPAADPQRLDDVETREGLLRHAVRTEKQVFVRCYAARELVGLDVKQHARFLKEQFFAEKKAAGIPNLRMSILIALGEPPLTAEKLDLLADLTSDPRLTPLMIQPNTVMGNDQYRFYAAWSLNAHAGKEVIDYARLPNQAQREGFAKAWESILQEVRDLAKQRHRSDPAP